jgi:hypothetical protein
MNKSLGSELIVYGVLLAGLSCLAHHLAPAIARPTLIAGLAGGALCLVWGILAVLGKRGKALPVLTLIPVCYVLLSQAILALSGRNEGGLAGRMVPILISVLFVISLVMLMKIAYAGAAIDGKPAVLAEEQPGKPVAPGKPESGANRRG